MNSSVEDLKQRLHQLHEIDKTQDFNTVRIYEPKMVIPEFEKHFMPFLFTKTYVINPLSCFKRMALLCDFSQTILA
jgi:hypothetical protein